jgi:hypothetical protein
MLLPAHVSVSDEQSYPFSQRELARLLVYRAAVQAGFYNESGVQPDRPTIAPAPDSTHLTIPDSP